MSALLLDVHSLFFRAHHALPPMTTSRGEPTSALYGLSVLLLQLLREQRPTGLAFARDLPQPTFRHERYTEYKAGRPPVPDALRPQFDRLEELLAATGAPWHAAKGFEADDVLATLARRLAPEEVTVVSGDRDLFQVVDARVQVLFVGARGKKPTRMNEAGVLARYGVPPRALPTFFALVGEDADNLVGVRGIGPRTARDLVTTYGTVDAMLANVASVHPAKVQTALGEAADRLRLNESLARLVDDVPLPGGPLTAPITSAARSALRKIFGELEFRSLLPRLEALVLPHEGQLSLFGA